MTDSLDRICPICGNKIEGPKQRKYCSPRCRGIATYQRHRERHYAKTKRWKKANKDKVSEENKRYYEANKEKIRKRRAKEFPTRPLIQTIWGTI